MSCRLCLSTTEILISIFNENGEDTSGIVNTVAKFLDVQLAFNDDGSNQICVNCWSIINNFNKFCAMVATKQQELQAKQHLAQEINAVSAEVACEKHNVKGETNFEHEIEMPIDSASDFEDALSWGSKGGKSGDIKAVTSHITKNKKCQHTEENKFEEHEGKTLAHSKSEPTTSEGANNYMNINKTGRPPKNGPCPKLMQEKIIAENMKLICDICKEPMKGFYLLKKHFKTVHNKTGYAVCCKKRLYERFQVVDHINYHKNPDYFKCVHCDQTFADRNCLTNHTTLKHKRGDELKFQCKHCDKKFARQYLLDTHALKHASEEERKFICVYCQKGYVNETRLRVHIRDVHSDYKKHVCNYCGTLLLGKDSFERHMEKHEGVKVDRKIQCDVCGKWLKGKVSLRLHMERHTDQREYSCEICGKEVASRLSLRAHYSYHHSNAEPTHKCHICGRSFKLKYHLREHITTHTGETLYDCPYCGKKFKCSSNLHRHRKIKHPVEWARDKTLPIEKIASND